MTRDEIISGLEREIKNIRREPRGKMLGICITADEAEDIISLLKEQEPREPHYTKLEYTVNGMPVAINHPECPRCYDNGLVLWDAEIEKGAAYCKRCGQAVKWNDD